MERLTTRNSAGVAVLKTPYQCERCGEVIYRLADYGSGEPIEKLSGLEDLEEQGKLLKLPCAVGDTVYTIYSISAERHFIYDFKLDERNLVLNAIYGNFGKEVFLTREEAEEALKRMEDGK